MRRLAVCMAQSLSCQMQQPPPQLPGWYPGNVWWNSKPSIKADRRWTGIPALFTTSSHFQRDLKKRDKHHSNQEFISVFNGEQHAVYCQPWSRHKAQWKALLKMDYWKQSTTYESSGESASWERNVYNTFVCWVKILNTKNNTRNLLSIPKKFVE